jgi:hypothetical protein
MKLKNRNIQEMIRAKEQIERGAATPAKVWEVCSDGKGGFTRRPVDPKAFRRAQKGAWDNSIAATRQKLGLSQSRCPAVGYQGPHAASLGTRHPHAQRRRPRAAADGSAAS